jgi:hypothetical protein
MSMSLLMALLKGVNAINLTRKIKPSKKIGDII